MPHTLQSNTLERHFTPRWTWRSVLLASTVSLGIYLLLPSLERRSAAPDSMPIVRSVSTATLPPPVPPPVRIERKTYEHQPPPPQPTMQEIRRQLIPLQAVMNLRMAIGDVGGDFSVNFGLSTEPPGEMIKQLVFEISDLDEPPRPLVQLKTLYPPRARMQQIEGAVMLEFVVTAEGAVRDIVVRSSYPDEVFTAAAIRAIERWRFAPGTRGGEAVATRVRQRVEFKMN